MDNSCTAISLVHNVTSYRTIDDELCKSILHLEEKVYLPCKVLTILQMHDIIIEAKFKDCSSIPSVFGSVSIETFFTITSANSFKRTSVTGKGLFLVC